MLGPCGSGGWLVAVVLVELVLPVDVALAFDLAPLLQLAVVFDVAFDVAGLLHGCFSVGTDGLFAVEAVDVGGDAVVGHAVHLVVGSVTEQGVGVGDGVLVAPGGDVVDGGVPAVTGQWAVGAWPELVDPIGGLGTSLFGGKFVPGR